MKLHEFQSKRILSRHGLIVPEGGVAVSAEEAREIARALGKSPLVVKAQVQTADCGPRGRHRAASPAEVEQAAKTLLKKRLVTDKSGPSGWAVKRVLVEPELDTGHSLDVALYVSSSAGGIVVRASRRGGDAVAFSGEAEEISFGTGRVFPEYEMLLLATRLGLTGDVRKNFVRLVEDLLGAFVSLDASRIELNPLAVQPDGSLLALNARLSIDDSALFRQPDLAALRDDDELDVNAQQRQLNYVSLDGNIGIVANGAGLGLATLDMVRAAKGRPANFMDIRTTATSLDVAHGFGLILDNPNVRAMLVNVHGGGMQPCDTIAEGLGIAIRRTGRTLPTVVRLAGNNAAFARSRLSNFGCQIIDCPDMWSAAQEAVSAAR